MEDLGMETLDLYLIHAPWPWSEVGADYTRENIETWRAMEEIGQNGRCRARRCFQFQCLRSEGYPG